jgi:uncharacterized protein
VDLRLALVLLVVIATTGVADKATPTVPAAWRPAEVHFLDRGQGTLALAVRPSRLHDVAPAEVTLLRLPAPITERTVQAALASSFGAATAAAAVQRLVERGLLVPADAPERTLLPRGPLTRLELGVAEDCNLRCPYCFVTQGSFGGARRVMPPLIAERAVDLLFDESADAPDLQIGFYGGEPLLNPDVIRHVVTSATARADETGKEVRFDLITNGTRLTPDLVAFLREHGVAVQLSLDGPPKTNDAIRPKAGGQGSYRQATAPLPLFQDYAALQGRATLTRANPEVDDVVEHLLELELPSVVARPVVGAEGGLGLDEAAARRIVEGYERLAERCLAATTTAEAARRAAPFLGYFGKLIDGQPRRVPCQQEAWAVACAADGALYPCKDMAAKPEYQIGTVWSGIDWDKAYDTTSGKLLCQQLAPKKAECATCWGRELCQISCMHVCLEPKGQMPSGDPRYSGWECWTSLGIIEIALDLFHRLRQERPAVFWAILGPAQSGAAGLVSRLTGDA